MTYENLKNAQKDAQRSAKNFKPTMLLVQGPISDCLLAVLGLQGIVVKSTAAIFFRTADLNAHGRGSFEEVVESLIEVNLTLSYGHIFHCYATGTFHKI